MVKIMRIPLGLNNAYLIKEDGKNIMVDSGQPEDAPRLLKELRKHGIGRGDIGLLVITHAHRDHMGNAAMLRQELEAPVVIHCAEEEYLAEGRNAPIVPYSWEGKLVSSVFRKMTDEPAAALKADLVFTDRLDLTEFGIGGLLLSTPGHTIGSSSVIIGEEAVIGDLLMMAHPFPGVPGVTWYAEDPIAVWDSIKRLRQSGVQRIYPGHGGCWEMSWVEKLLRDHLVPKKRRLGLVGL